MMESMQLMILEPNKLFREGLRRLLSDSFVDVCAEESTLAKGLEYLKANGKPDMVLFDPCELDLANQGEEAEIYSSLRLAAPTSKLVTLTSRLTPKVFNAAMQADVDGFLLKDMSADALIQSLKLVIVGEKVFPTNLAASLVSGSFREATAVWTTSSARGLSDREVQILRCLLNGHPNKLIANELSITEGTVKVHIKGILSKIKVRNRTQAAIWAMNNGLGNGSSTLPVAAST